MADTKSFDPHSPDADPARPINTKTEVNGQVTLVDYDPAWPGMFQWQADRIRTALGDRVILVEHMGSTAVPGLIAKPCIDILLVVENASDDAAYVPDLKAAGYVPRISEEDDGEAHRVFKGPDINLNLHVWSSGSAEVDRHLDFRDWLRVHPDDRDCYADAKRKIAANHWAYMQDYADAKDDVVREITARMRQATRA